MSPRQAYNIDAEWDDPFERQAEQRASGRCRAAFKLTITADDERLKGRLVGPGLVKNMSLTGAFLVTKHRLEPGQRVTVAISTDFCPDHMGLPGAFIGPAEVVRLEPSQGRTVLVGLQFGEVFSENMDFAVFQDYLQSISQVMASK